MKPKQNYPLKNLTTFKIGGPARYFTEVTNEKKVFEAIKFSEKKRLSVFVLGKGSNVVINDEGFPGLVIHNKIKGFSAKENKNSVMVNVGAGEIWDEVVRRCVEKNWAGIECLSGIPGTAGAAPIQNIGAYGQEISSVIKSVRVFDIKTKTTKELTREQCKFGYRSSIFNTVKRGEYIITRVSLKLTLGAAPCIMYQGLLELFRDQNAPSLSSVRNAVIEIRAKKKMLILTGYKNYRSAGSFFKHPLVDKETFERVKKTAKKSDKTSQWYWELPSGKIKILATYLIRQTGFFPGYRKGNVGISPHHALSLVSYDGTANDIVLLAKEIQDSVREKFGVVLAPEPEFVGFEKHPLK